MGCVQELPWEGQPEGRRSPPQLLTQEGRGHGPVPCDSWQQVIIEKITSDSFSGPGRILTCGDLESLPLSFHPSGAMWWPASGPQLFKPQWLPEVENQKHLQGCLSLQSSHTIRLAPEAILVLTGESVKAGGTGPGVPVEQERFPRRLARGLARASLGVETPVHRAG